jgi:hypothetical protein
VPGASTSPPPFRNDGASLASQIDGARTFNRAKRSGYRTQACVRPNWLFFQTLSSQFGSSSIASTLLPERVLGQCCVRRDVDAGLVSCAGCLQTIAVRRDLKAVLVLNDPTDATTFRSSPDPS